MPENPNLNLKQRNYTDEESSPLPLCKINESRTIITKHIYMYTKTFDDGGSNFGSTMKLVNVIDRTMHTMRAVQPL